MAPIRFGKYVAKYRAKPAGNRHDSYLDLVKRFASQADAMRLSLEETLRTQEVLFVGQVQLPTSEHTMPIEDASIEWPESASPYRTVANLLLPRQEIEFLRQQNAYQNLSFNVWHALAAHCPLGGINRVRRRAYALSSAWRLSKPARCWQSRQALVKSADNLQPAICLRGHPHFQLRRLGESRVRVDRIFH